MSSVEKKSIIVCGRFAQILAIFVTTSTVKNPPENEKLLLNIYHEVMED